MSDARPSPDLTIVETRVYRGPNVWSYDKALHVVVDLGVLEQYPTDRLEGFTDGLLELLPGLERHTCSRGHRGGFVERLREGTWLGHVTEHVALELQSRAGAPVTRGKTRSVRGQPGTYDVMYAYQEEEPGLLAGRAALQILEALLPVARRGVQDLPRLHEDDPGAEPRAAIERIGRLVRRQALGPTTRSLARARGGAARHSGDASRQFQPR